jgi:hypothetical protein
LRRRDGAGKQQQQKRKHGPEKSSLKEYNVAAVCTACVDGLKLFHIAAFRDQKSGWPGMQATNALTIQLQRNTSKKPGTMRAISKPIDRYWGGQFAAASK